MSILVRLAGLLIVIMGLTGIFSPDYLKRIFEFFQKGKRIYLAGMIRVIFGVVFLLAASVCRSPGTITVLGILFLAAGILIFVLGPKKILPVIEWLVKRPANVWRLLLLFVLVLGGFIIYSA